MSLLSNDYDKALEYAYKAADADDVVMEIYSIPSPYDVDKPNYIATPHMDIPPLDNWTLLTIISPCVLAGE